MLILSFLFCIKTTYGQLQLSGKVTDAQGKVLEFASVGLFKDSSVNVSGTISDSLGHFSFEGLAPQSYTVQASLVGTMSKIINVLLLKDTSIIIRIDSFSNNLQEISINADRPLIERGIDRIIFNVAAANSTIGGDAIDALKVTPRINIENGKLSMIGKSGMAIMINDKIIQLSGDALMGLLKSIRSEDIKSIEVIPNPPSQYSAEGNSGIVNIKLKRAMNDSWNSLLYGVYQQATYPTGTLGGNFNLQLKKLSVSAGGGFTDGSNAPVETNKIFYPAGLWSEITRRRDYSQLFTFRLGLDYEFSPKMTAGIQFIKNGSKSNSDEADRVSLINNLNLSRDSTINTISNSGSPSSLNAFNFHSIYNFDTIGRKLAFDVDVFNYNNTNGRVSKTTRSLGDNSEIIAGSYGAFNNAGKQNINNYSFNVVMNHPLSWVNLSYGGRLSFSNTNNSVRYYNLITGVPVIDLSQSNDFLYKENTQALFASANKKISEKWQSQIGIRMESTQTLGKSVETNQTNSNSYFKFFPTAYISYIPNDLHSFSLTFGRRINRPPYYRLNPFKWYYNPYSYSEGNPYLQPSSSYNLEFNYILQNNFSSTLYSSFEKGGFDQVTYIDGQVQRVYVENFYNNYSQGINESYTFKKLKWVTVNASVDVNYSMSKSTNPSFLPKNNGFNGAFSLSNDIVFNKAKTMILNVGYNYSLAGVSGLDKVSPYSQLNLTFKYLMFKNKFQIALYGNDVFKTNMPSHTSYTNGIKIVYKNYYDIRFFRITLVYRFGNNTLKTKQNEEKNQEERKRL